MKKLLLLIILTVFAFAAYAADPLKPVTIDEKIYAPEFTANFIVYIMNPDRVAGWCGSLMEHELPYIPVKYQKLPVFGGWWNAGILDKELLVKEKVKKSFVIGKSPNFMIDRLEELKKLNMDVYLLYASSIHEYIPLLRDLSVYMGIPERGEELAVYGEGALARSAAMVKDIPEDKKLRVFVAGGPTGLMTTCGSEVIALSGGVNAYDCSGVVKGSELQLSFEQIMKLDPDVIISANPASGKKIHADPKWKRLRAFKEGRVYAVPYAPFGWMHMPEITRFMAVQWLSCTLYPDRCSIDVQEETKKFLKLFMHLDLTDAEVKEILSRY